MSKPPVVIPLGAMRFNSDSQKLEYWNGLKWRQVITFSPDLNGGGRGINMGGTNYVNVIDYVTISTSGNATDFGDLITGSNLVSGGSSSTRSFIYGGRLSPGTPKSNHIEYVTFSSTGNSTDFGDFPKTFNYGCIGNLGNATRGMQCAGSQGSPADVDEEMYYITYASAGNANDFGDTSSNHSDGGNVLSSSTRGVIAGGSNAGNVIEYITIATTGNAFDFGDMTTINQGAGSSANSTRGVFIAGYIAANINTIEYVTISTTGNAVNFGEVADARRWGAGMASPTRALLCGGYSGAYINTIDYIEISTGGDAVDFGDLVAEVAGLTSNSNCHGGLG